jgi:hypothetical protein
MDPRIIDVGVPLNLSEKLNYAVLHTTEDLFLNEIRG